MPLCGEKLSLHLAEDFTKQDLIVFHINLLSVEFLKLVNEFFKFIIYNAS